MGQITAHPGENMNPIKILGVVPELIECEREDAAGNCALWKVTKEVSLEEPLGFYVKPSVEYGGGWFQGDFGSFTGAHLGVGYHRLQLAPYFYDLKTGDSSKGDFLGGDVSFNIGQVYSADHLLPNYRIVQLGLMGGTLDLGEEKAIGTGLSARAFTSLMAYGLGVTLKAIATPFAENPGFSFFFGLDFAIAPYGREQSQVSYTEKDPRGPEFK